MIINATIRSATGAAIILMRRMVNNDPGHYQLHAKLVKTPEWIDGDFSDVIVRARHPEPPRQARS